MRIARPLWCKKVAVYLLALLLSAQPLLAYASTDRNAAAQLFGQPQEGEIVSFTLKPVPTAAVESHTAKMTQLSQKRIQQILAQVKADPVKDKPAPMKSPVLVAIDNEPPPVNVQLAESGGKDAGGSQTSKKPLLRITSHSPNANQNVASDITVHFSEQMVPMGSLDKIGAETIAATIEPAIAGEWRWLDTSTLYFKCSESRLPMATRFQVKISGEMKSVYGATLGSDFTWSFETSPLHSMNALSNDWLAKDNLIAVYFDQKVDAQSVLPFAHLTAKGREYGLTLAKSDEIGPHGARFGATTIFKAASDTPQLEPLTLTLDKGAPASEGSLRSTQVLNAQCQVGILPFRLLSRTKKTSDKVIVFDQNHFQLDFSVLLAPEQNLNSLVRVEWELPDQSIQTRGDAIVINGKTALNQSYKVFIDPALKDIYGRRLGSEARETFIVRPTPTPRSRTARVEQEPNIQSPTEEIVVLPPFASNILPIFSTNEKRLRIRAYSSDVKDLELRHELSPLPGRPADYDKILNTPKFRRNRLNSTTFDLSTLLKNDTGLVLLDVCDPSISRDDSRYHNRHIRVWLEKTNLAVRTIVGSTKTVCWVTNLTNNAPESGVDIEVAGTNCKGVTGRNGIAEIAYRSAPRFGTIFDTDLPYSDGEVLIARRGEDIAVLPYPRNEAERQTALVNAFTDRGLYRPGEKVHIKGWIRSRKNEPFADLNIAPPELTKVQFRVLNGAKEIAKGDCPIGNRGGFDLAFVVPKDVPLGCSTVELKAGPDRFPLEKTLQFSVEEFRKPEFEMTVRSADSSPKYMSDHICFDTSAKYFSGPGLSSAAVNWRVCASAGWFKPPGWNDYSFQLDYQFNQRGRSGRYLRPGRSAGLNEAAPRSMTGKTDRNGLSRLQLDINRLPLKQPCVFTTEATVKDLSAQTFSASTSALVHPAKVYVGLKSEKQIVHVGDDFPVATIVTDIDGHAVAGMKCQLCVVQKKQQSPEDSEEVETLLLTDWISTDKPVAVSVKIPRHGQCEFVATVIDVDGHENCASYGAMATDSVLPTPVETTAQKLPKVLQLLADKKIYEPGDQAKIHIDSPFARAQGLLTVKHRGIASVSAFELNGGETDVTVPISPSFMPSCQVLVDLVSKNPAEDGLKPVFTAIYLPITTKSRVLNLTVKPTKEKVEPGTQSTIVMSARHADGTPARNADLCAIVVDEAVLALNGYQISDQENFFYLSDRVSLGNDDVRFHLVGDGNPIATHGLSVGLGRTQGPRDLNLFQVEPTVIDERHYTSGRDERHQKISPTLPEGSPIPDNDGGTNAAIATKQPFKIRSNFDSLALFRAAATTDDDGYASVSFTLPDTLTRYRVIVVAAAEEKYFGKAESHIEVDQELSVRPSPPRFANIGDRFDLPVVIRNGSDQRRQVELVVNAHGALSGNDGFSVSLQPGQRVDAYAKLKAELAGAASVDVVAVSPDGKSDVSRQQITVNVSPTAEDFATYGSLGDGNAAQMVDRPQSKDLLSSDLRVTLSSTAASDMHGAVDYLHFYPYGCSEQLASRIIAFSAVRNMPLALRNEIIDSDSPGLIQSNIIDLNKRQNSDGGFLLWPEHLGDSVPFVSIHVLHALIVAKAAGYVVDPDVLERGKQYLKSLEEILDRRLLGEGSTRSDLLAYACYVSDMFGVDDATRAKSAVKNKELRYVSLNTLGWILPTLIKTKDPIAQNVLDTIHSAAKETASTAHFTDDSRDQEYLFCSPDSDTRLNALLLSTLLTVQPDDPLIPKIVKPLLLARNNGHWVNTDEDAFSLLALSAYFAKFEHEPPNFAADLWLDSMHLAKQKFAFRASPPRELKFDLLGHSSTKPGAMERLVLAKTGPGRLYYRVGVSYALRTQDVKALDRGFSVTRTYTAADGQSLEQKADGLHIKKGTTIKVTVQISAPSRRYYVALVDQLPAGFEAVNAALNGTNTTERFADSQGSYLYFGEDFHNLRDDRTEVFKSNLAPGRHEYSYFVHASTAGQFLAPPAKVEEMYNPETFGRSASSRLIIDDDERM